ncbi:hypothetical protein C6P40_001602 [Pichia californica]|uniref:Uncharacterized protein n=1 Tax=Pichia californica TaxID=460514 RepID=A0A9P6WJG6_9ASCO|nr:hypothetical protein C6P42_000155 [[Candida] californica]KAG0687944.1 hypothetical protein C6P40_001602 [[Candida] californica]
MHADRAATTCSHRRKVGSIRFVVGNTNNKTVKPILKHNVLDISNNHNTSGNYDNHDNHKSSCKNDSLKKTVVFTEPSVSLLGTPTTISTGTESQSESKLELESEMISTTITTTPNCNYNSNTNSNNSSNCNKININTITQSKTKTKNLDIDKNKATINNTKYQGSIFNLLDTQNNLEILPSIPSIVKSNDKTSIDSYSNFYPSTVIPNDLMLDSNTGIITKPEDILPPIDSITLSGNDDITITNERDHIKILYDDQIQYLDSTITQLKRQKRFLNHCKRKAYLQRFFHHFHK